jgi:hypothetical protein
MVKLFVTAHRLGGFDEGGVAAVVSLDVRHFQKVAGAYIYSNMGLHHDELHQGHLVR